MSRKEENIPLRDDLEKTFRPIFEEHAETGGIPLRVLRAKLKPYEDQFPPGKMEVMLRRADEDMDGHLEYEEFMRLMTSKNKELTAFQRMVRGAVNSVVPGDTKSKAGGEYVNNYIEHYNCNPPPLFMILISIAEVAVFIYYAVELKDSKYPVTATSGVPLYSPLIYNPSRRYEAWRFLTYMLLHQGYMHLIFNLIFQLLLGIPLEMVHKWWRMGIVYSLGVIAGSMCHSVFDTNTMLAGASGGCYALIGAHFAIVIMNWKEMTHGWLTGPVKFISSAPVRLLIWTLVAGIDTGLAIYNRYNSDAPQNVGYAAHFGGAVCGLLIGIPVLKNIDEKPWERVVFWVALVIYLLGFLFCAAWNAFYPKFPPSDWSPCCKMPQF